MEVPTAEPVVEQPTTGAGLTHKAIDQFNRRFQKILDDSIPYILPRWGGFAVMFILFWIRIFTVQGWYIVAYSWGIFLLNGLIGFLTPKFDKRFSESLDEDEGMELPTSVDEEYRPFVRRLPEFKFWYSSMRATFIAFFCTFFRVFNLPVFWPVLVVYFITLFTVTMKRQIQHMIKFKYIPFDFGKKAFKPAEAGRAGPKVL